MAAGHREVTGETCTSGLLRSLDPRSEVMRQALSRARVGVVPERVTQLIRAAKAANDEQLKELVRRLQQQSGPETFAQQLFDVDELGRSVLFHVRRVETVQLLARAVSADVLRSYLNRQLDVRGATALHRHCETGQFDVALLLLELGASAGALNDKGFSPLTLLLTNRSEAQLAKQTELAQRLVRAAPQTVNTPTTSMRTALHQAATQDLLPVAELLIASGASLTLPDSAGNLPLHYAVLNGNAHMVRLLAERAPHTIHLRFPRPGKHSPLLCDCDCPLTPDGDYLAAADGCLPLTPSAYQLATRSAGNAQQLDCRLILDQVAVASLHDTLAQLTRHAANDDHPDLAAAVVMLADDLARALRARFATEQCRRTLGRTPRLFWCREIAAFAQGVWGPLALRVYASRRQRLFVDGVFAAAHDSIMALYDDEFSVQNAVWPAVMHWLVQRNPRGLGVRSRDVRLWFPQFAATATATTDAAPSSERRAACQRVLAAAVEHLADFSRTPSPVHKIHSLRMWGQTLIDGLAAANDGVVDPDFMMFLRAWTFASAGIANVSSQLRYLSDYLLDQSDPKQAGFDADRYEHFEVVAVLDRTIDSLAALRNTTEWLVTKFENGLVVNMASAPASLTQRLVDILALFQQPVDAARHTFVLPYAGCAAQLEWLARDWDLAITEDPDAATTTVVVLNPNDFPLTPHACEEILLRLARFQK